MRQRLIETTRMPEDAELRRLAGALLRVVAEELDALEYDPTQDPDSEVHIDDTKLSLFGDYP